MLGDTDDDGTKEIISCLEINEISQYTNFYKKNGGDSLGIYHVNIRSFSKNFDELVVYLNSFIQYLDIIVLTECWLREGGVETGLGGFDLFQTDRQRNQNDGVIVYVNKALSATATQVTLGDVYGISLSFTMFNKQFDLLAVYRTFDSDPLIFTDELGNYINNVNRNKMVILLGDINLDLLQRNVTVDKYLDLLLGCGFYQCIDKPTRADNDSMSCLDHIFLKYDDCNQVNSAVIQTAITDHYSTGLTITTTAAASKSKHTTPPLTYLDHALLTHYLTNSNWDPVVNCRDDVDICSRVFSKIIINSVDCSKKQLKPHSSRHKKLKPWITLDLVRQIRVRDKMNKQVKKQPFNTALIECYRGLKRDLNNNIKQTKRAYYRQKLNESSGNPKHFWALVNALAGRVNKKDSFPIDKFIPNASVLTQSCKQVADEFNKFFSIVGRSLAHAIDSSGIPVVSDSNYRLDCTFTLQTVTEDNLRRYVFGLRGGSAPGYDGISANVLKENFHLISNPLLHIVNLSLTSGVFPDCFKLAKVFPLYKSNDVTDKNNFRPISLLSVFAKIIEKIVKDQLISYLQYNNILSERQYGFRQDKNISDSLFDISRELNGVIYEKEHPMLIFLDLKKAFDSVDRAKLLSKLEIIGIRGKALSWFTTYLSNRFQFVSICGNISDNLPVDYGVVQGSNLGPILFLIYINNISKLNISGKLFLFADDTLIFLRGKTWDEVKERASHDVMIVKKWLDQNILTLNTSKTKFLPISISPRTDYNLGNLKIHTCNNHHSNNCSCDTIEKVDSYKYLGVVFDHRLKWNYHIQYVKTKIRKYMFAFRQMYGILSNNEMKMAYFAYVQSLLSFGIVAWGGCFKSVLDPLNVTQKSILKIAFGKSRRYPTDALFNETSVLTVRKLYIKNILIVIYKNFNTLFEEIRHSHNTRYSSGVGITTVQLSNTFSTTNSYYISHIVFRNLCNYFSGLNLFQSPSFNTYKDRIKNWLLRLGVDEADLFITTDYRRPWPDLRTGLSGWTPFP